MNNKLLLASFAACLATSLFAADLLAPPDVADRWKLEKYLSDDGLTCLVDTPRCLRLLDEALAHKAYEGRPERLIWKKKKAWIEMMTCADTDLNAKIDAYLAALSEDDPTIVKPDLRENFAVDQLRALGDLYSNDSGNLPFRDRDVKPLMQKVRQRLPGSIRVQKEYYEAVLKSMWWQYGPTAWDVAVGVDPLARDCSYEAQLAFIETGFKDPLLKGDVTFLKYARIVRLTKLERFAEVEKAYAELCATTNLAEKVKAHSHFADYWEKRAKRFYTSEWKPFLKKSLENFDQVEAHADIARKNVYIANWRDRATDVAMRLGDAMAAKKWLDRRTTRKDGKDVALDDDFSNFRRGILAWDAKDLDGVIAHLSKVSKQYINKEQLVGCDRVAHYAKLAKAYDMKGLYDEELKTLEILREKGGGSWKDYYAYVAEQVKAISTRKTAMERNAN